MGGLLVVVCNWIQYFMNFLIHTYTTIKIQEYYNKDNNSYDSMSQWQKKKSAPQIDIVRCTIFNIPYHQCMANA